MKSWKTSLLGVLTIVGALCAAGVALLDGDPATNPSWAITGTAFMTGLGLMQARDNDKTSKDAGAEK